MRLQEGRWLGDVFLNRAVFLVCHSPTLKQRPLLSLPLEGESRKSVPRFFSVGGPPCIPHNPSQAPARIYSPCNARNAVSISNSSCSFRPISPERATTISGSIPND